MSTETSDEGLALREENARLRAALEDLRDRLREPEDLVRAIRFGEVDAFVVSEKAGEKVYGLRRADHLCRLIVEDMREGAVAVAGGGTIVYCNHHFAAMVGVRREELVSRPFQSLVVPSDRDRFGQLLRNAGNGDHRGELGLIGPSGSVIPVEVATNCLTGLAEAADVCCVVVTDLTPHKRQEELLQADRRKNEFLAVLGHELRNPLAALVNGIQVLQAIDSENEQVRRVHTVLERQARHMSRLIDDLLDVTRITRNRIALRKERLDVRELIEKVAEDERPVLDESGCALELKMPAEPIWIEADSTRASQVIGNLLHNACKFTDPGGRITASVHQDAERGAAVVSVRDTGIGMEPSILQRLFEPFSQADDSLDRSRGGLGLGLALVKGIVELHGGTVAVHSDGPGKGSEFILCFPLAGEEAAASGPGRRPTTIPRAAQRVLVVEDSVPVAEIFAMILREMGHEVEVATSGEAALELIGGSQPQVVFSDISMPRMSGHDLARALREQPGRDGLVLVAMTGYGQPEDRDRALEAGFDFHLVKPADRNRLESLFAEIAARKSASR
jgi:PAS domain S-box-containing protein